MNGLVCRLASILIRMVIVVCSAGCALTQAQVGVVPFAAEKLHDSLAVSFTAALQGKLASRMSVVDESAVAEALEEIECSAQQRWQSVACLCEVGERCGARYVLSGKISRGDGFHVVHVLGHEVASGLRVLAKAYRVKGPFSQLCDRLPETILKALPSDVARAPVRVLPPPEETVVIIEEDRVAEPSTPKSAPPPQVDDFGIVPALTIGGSGYCAVDEASRTQSPAGFTFMAAYPTGGRSQARVKAGIPLWLSHSAAQTVPEKLPDAYVALEHDWGWRFFGLGVGVAYMQLAQFTKSAHAYYREYDNSSYYYYDEYLYYQYQVNETYESVPAFNVTANLRLGKPSAGFFGRFSWPLGFTVDSDEPLNLFFEYSAYGAFTIRNAVKLGMGFNGMRKIREPSEGSIVRSDTVYVSETQYGARYELDPHTTNEFFVLLPCIRVAWLANAHLVLSLNIELGGLILPRQMATPFYVYQDYDEDPDLDWWKPSVGMGVVFSFGKLTSPGLYDGLF